jgi:hypothetical protein
LPGQQDAGAGFDAAQIGEGGIAGRDFQGRRIGGSGQSDAGQESA